MPDSLIHDLPMQTRAAAVRTVDESARTVELVWSTGAGVPRVNYRTGERFMEVLSLDPEHCDLTRLNNGAPLLNAHGQYDLSQVIGVVERAAVDGSQGTALVRFSERPDVEPFWNDVRTGIIRNVSVGYAVRKFEVTQEEGALPTYRAIDWQPMELSMVPIGADAGAGTRSADLSSTPCEFINRAKPATQESTMPDTVQHEPGTELPVDNTRAVGTDAGAVSAAIAAERARIAHVNDVAQRHALGADFVRTHVDGGSTAEAVNTAALAALAARSEQSPTSSIRVGISHDDPAAVRSAMADAIVARATYSAPENERARGYMDVSMLEMAADLCGIRSRNPDEILRRAMHSTSDFPLLLEAAANKVLRRTYEAAQPTYRRIARRRDFNDFKPTKFLQAGDFPQLLEYGETGEIKDGTVSEGRETVTLSSFGRIVNISRRVFINDDLGAFNDLVNMASRRVADFENATFYAMMLKNSGAGPTLSDNKAVFHTGHGNLAASGSAIGVSSVSDGRAAMRKQTSLDGLKINVTPSMIVCGPDKETEAEQLLATIQPQQAGNVNPFSGRLSTVADANISGNQWWLFADPAVAEVFVYGYLAGNPGPRFMTEEGFRTDGVALRVTLDFGCGAVDYRGGYRNPGN
ncbi:prohead protease/major capsid protein fusion protein [Azospirillum sp. BE72]|uniref:prohead protease/major capsid protein fusion protein n=1 Tax=Azospirillum sp. BE72 TaxID=2817776 RepID=UPI0028573F6C|nr:prohead protease/major capsid protein fusion protein [Azospirillum sp. BE72]MDR6770377.1 phage major head subunit gpT-like protein [Azospirillum sp. BE72]